MIESLEQNKKVNFDDIDKIIDSITIKLKNKKKQFNCIGLIGDLGTGKTTFTRKLLNRLGVNQSVKSPSFTYMIEYTTSDFDIYHFDVYRLSDSTELYSIGFFDYVDTPCVLIVEWANNILDEMPEDTLFIEIKHCNLENRYISIYTIKGGEKIYENLSNYNI